MGAIIAMAPKCDAVQGHRAMGEWAKSLPQCALLAIWERSQHDITNDDTRRSGTGRLGDMRVPAKTS